MTNQPRSQPDRTRSSVILCALALGLSGSQSVSAQPNVALSAIVDLEGWTTDSGSRLLARNGGRPVGLGRLTTWASLEIRRNLHAFVVAEFERETGTASETEIGVEQIGLRFSPSRRLALEAGKLTTPFGIFGSRRFSTTNPLMGRPDSYDVAYPWGVSVAGSFSILDYRISATNLPVTNEKYVPSAGSAIRPTVSVGLTPAVGLRIGLGHTRGPYLGPQVSAGIPTGQQWQDYHQRITGIDARFSRGHFESRAEVAFSSFEVPGRVEPIRGVAGYLELKETWHPRLFTAIRLEGNDYAFIRLGGNGSWFSAKTPLYNGELGVGYRVDPFTTVKVSYRRDYWPVEASRRSLFPDGHAIAMQVNRRLDF